MSDILLTNQYFIKLLLDTTNEQSRALFQSITNKQILVISEICFNLLLISVDKSTQLIIKKRKKILEKLSNKKISLLNKKRIIKKHYIQLRHTLLHIKDKLLELLS